MSAEEGDDQLPVEAKVLGDAGNGEAPGSVASGGEVVVAEAQNLTGEVREFLLWELFEFGTCLKPVRNLDRRAEEGTYHGTGEVSKNLNPQEMFPIKRRSIMIYYRSHL